MTVFAILGSGFGLYGYLPALVLGGQSVLLPRRYERRFHARPELAPFLPAVHWAPTDLAALKESDGAVIAQRPHDQTERIATCAALSNVRRLLLEKPVGATPEAAALSLDVLDRARKSYRIGYTFLFTKWARDLFKTVPANTYSSVSIHWSFMAHHYRHNLVTWKRSHAEGGGALRFYGIQLIAVLAQLGYDGAMESQAFETGSGDVTRWHARFVASHMPPCQVDIDSQSPETAFEVIAKTREGEDVALFSSTDPFDVAAGPSGLDRRIAPIADILRSLSEDDARWVEQYRTVVRLWRDAESATSFQT